MVKIMENNEKTIDNKELDRYNNTCVNNDGTRFKYW